MSAIGKMVVCDSRLQKKCDRLYVFRQCGPAVFTAKNVLVHALSMCAKAYSSTPGDAHMRQKTKPVGSDNDFGPVRRQTIIWTNAGVLLIRPLGTNSSDILINLQKISFNKGGFENVISEMTAILFQSQCVELPCIYMRLCLHSCAECP